MSDINRVWELMNEFGISKRTKRSFLKVYGNDLDREYERLRNIQQDSLFTEIQELKKKELKEVEK